MSLKVIGAGFGRTGTLSLKHALERLGFDKAHHMMEVASSAAQINHWSAIAKGQPFDWDKVLEGYQSTTDFPACAYYAELAEKYPDAKVLLTLRDEDSWYRSVEQTILPMSKVIPGWMVLLAPPLRRLKEAVDTIVWQNTFGGRADDPAHAKAVFVAHNQQVIDAIPPERLLVFHPKEGWEPLCEFLGVPVPEEPFPHVNDTAEMQRRIRALRVIGYLPWIIAGGVALAWALTR